MFKILNLYAGIGGNRKLWDKPLKEKFGNDYQITAIEYNQEIAAIYKYFFPNDEVIVTDAHQYLLEHFKEFDFIWSSPPCPTHSRANNWLHAQGIIRYSDMSLYQEILLLKHYSKNKFVIENVEPYYNPLIIPLIKIDRHLFWTNYFVNKKEIKLNNKNLLNAFSKNRLDSKTYLKKLQELHKTNLDKFNISIDFKLKILRNMVNPEIGLHFLNRALEIKESEKVQQGKLFT